VKRSNVVNGGSTTSYKSPDLTEKSTSFLSSTEVEQDKKMNTKLNNTEKIDYKYMQDNFERHDIDPLEGLFGCDFVIFMIATIVTPLVFIAIISTLIAKYISTRLPKASGSKLK
jgi:CRISPR/Cas system CMR-associated protein Cmr1 (group 7 of RAMP superfamily)